jgi:acyl carrier protein
MESIVRDIQSRLRELFRERLHLEVPTADTDLLESGLLDSLQFVALLAHVEREFGVALPLVDLELERVSTLAAIGELVHGLSRSADALA